MNPPPSKTPLGAVIFAFVLAGCGGSLAPVNTSPHEALPLPGTVHLVSAPAQAPYPVVIRHMSGDDASGAYHEFVEGETILVVFSNLPGEKGVQVNGRACDGRYMLTTGFETDVLLRLGDGTCRVEVLGSHAEGSVHSDPPTEPKVGANPAGSPSSRDIGAP